MSPPLSTIHTIVSDSNLSKDYIKAAQEMGTELILANVKRAVGMTHRFYKINNSRLPSAKVNRTAANRPTAQAAITAPAASEHTKNGLSASRR
jgi:hypothetical protein